MIKKILLTALLMVAMTVYSDAKKRYNELYFGGGIGVAKPSNIASNDELGYKDVAGPGLHVQMQAQWFYAKTLTIGGEISYSSTPQSHEFWDVQNRGEVTNYYRTLGFTAMGRYYFAPKEFKPFAGIGFGAYYLMNEMEFNSNNYLESASYTSNVWKPGFAPELGFLYQINKKTFFYSNLRLQFIPNMEPETINIYDDFGYVDDTVTLYPHGHQNHFLLVVGLLF